MANVMKKALTVAILICFTATGIGMMLYLHQLYCPHYIAAQDNPDEQQQNGEHGSEDCAVCQVLSTSKLKATTTQPTLLSLPSSSYILQFNCETASELTISVQLHPRAPPLTLLS